MTFALETPATGTARLAPGNTDAFTILGKDVSAAQSAGEALAMANMSGWNVSLWDDAVVRNLDDSGFTVLPMDDARGVVRTSPITGEAEYMGKVGNQYTAVQIEDHVDVLDMLRKESGATFHKAGAYGKNGARWFISMTLPEILRIGGVDEHHMHLTLFGSHDGSSANSFHIGPKRLDCGNMQRIIIKGAAHSYSIPHTASAPAKLAQVHEALATLLGWQDTFQRAAERLLDTPCTIDQLERVAARAFKDPAMPGKQQQKNINARNTRLRHLMEVAATQESIRGTAWAAWNAIGELNDHEVRAKSTAQRAANSLSDRSTATKRKTIAFQELSLAA
ncbi:DUF932 domain-containing protein [Streptomyces europaeiscabiei]|uniref:DUF932 domain-containing protein n=1 Tax=Streptomyces europaeiscabiei TaxID=146819 RepID=UPI0038F75123